MASGAVLIKLAARCNIKCTYCYWFRDPAVLESPKLLHSDVEDNIPSAVAGFAERTNQQSIDIIFHGGEPMLYPPERLDDLCTELSYCLRLVGCVARYSVTTNATLCDARRVRVLVKHNIRVTVSVDGSKLVHDSRRIDHQGRGTFDRVRKSVSCFKSEGLSVNALAVCAPKSNPQDLLATIADDLGIKDLDVLFPDVTYDDPNRESIATYYANLFDHWFDSYSLVSVKIRLFDVIMNRLLGGSSTSDVFGFSKYRVAIINTDGNVSGHDVTNAIPNWRNRYRDDQTIYEPLENIWLTPEYLTLEAAASNLPNTCNNCGIRHVCGGGHVVSRWSRQNGFNNVSAYCSDIQDIVNHIWRRIQPTLRIEVPS